MSYQEGDIVVEYAKSNRSKCKTCKSEIAKDSIRLGFAIKSPHFDGIQLTWYHTKCALTKVPDITLAKGFHDLKPADADKLSKKADAVGGPKSGAAATAAAMSAGYTDQFVVDYAKSGRSVCVHCEETIDQDEVRVGKNEQVETPAGFMRTQARWHHLQCVFKKEVIAVPEQIISGLTDLLPEDRDEIVQLIINNSPLPQVQAMSVGGATKRKKSSGGDDDSSSKKNKRKKKKSADDDDEEKEAAAEEKSAPATTDYSSMSAAQLKAECKARQLGVGGTKAVLIERLTQADNSTAMDTSDDAATTTATTTTATTSDESAIINAIRAESEAKWALKNKLKKALNNNDIKAILEHNDQYSKGGADRIMDALVEGMLYGKLPRCPECGNRGLTFEDGVYRCKSVTEWSSCGYTADDVERSEWEIPEEYEDYDELDQWTFQQQTKPVAALKHIANKGKAKLEEHKSAVTSTMQLVEDKRLSLLKEHEQTTLFANLKIIVAGSKLDPSAAAIKKMIVAGGGEIVTDADDADLLVTTSDNVNKPKGAALKAMIADNKPIVDVKFITECVSAAELLQPRAHSLRSRRIYRI